MAVPAREFGGVTFFESDVWRLFRPTLHHSCWNSSAAFASLALTMAQLLNTFGLVRWSLVSGELCAALLRLPSHGLTEILGANALLVANEDIVFDFVAVRLEVPGETPETAPLGSNAL